MTRKRQRKEINQSSFDSLSLVPIVDDGDTVRLGDEENFFPSFGQIGTESVLGKMGSILSLATQPSVATTAALVPLVSTLMETKNSSEIPQIFSKNLILGIASRCLVETNVDDLRLSRVKSAGSRWLNMHVFPSSNQSSVESLWESYQSFVNELVLSEISAGNHVYGLMEIPRLGTTSEWVYVEQVNGTIRLLATAAHSSEAKNFLDSVRNFGVEFELVEKPRQEKRDDESEDSDDDLSNIWKYITINDRENIFGFFDFLRSNLIMKLIKAAKSGSRNRWPILTSNCAFRHSCSMNPVISVRRGTDSKRFVEIDSINCPIIFVEKFVNHILSVQKWTGVKVTVRERELFEMFNDVRISSTSSPAIVELISE